MEEPGTAGYHHHKFTVMDEMKHHRDLKGQGILTDLMFFLLLNCKELTSSPRYLAVAPFVFYHLGKQALINIL